MPEYILLLHEDPSRYAAMSPAEMQAIVEKYKAWSETTGATGQLLGGHKLADSGRQLSMRGGAIAVTDGPYAETKEVIGGFFHIRAESYEEAVEISRTCPHVANGVVEVREIDVV